MPARERDDAFYRRLFAISAGISSFMAVIAVVIVATVRPDELTAIPLIGMPAAATLFCGTAFFALWLERDE